MKSIRVRCLTRKHGSGNDCGFGHNEVIQSCVIQSFRAVRIRQVGPALLELVSSVICFYKPMWCQQPLRLIPPGYPPPPASSLPSSHLHVHLVGQPISLDTRQTSLRDWINTYPAASRRQQHPRAHSGIRRARHCDQSASGTAPQNRTPYSRVRFGGPCP